MIARDTEFDAKNDMKERNWMKRGIRRHCILLILFLALSAIAPFPFKSAQAQESNGSISFQPSEIPNIGFSYNAQEYQFELTWKNYYLNIKPFAIYNGQYYDLKQIIPFLKNQYPNIDYRTAVQKFKNYHRWGYWLEKLPQNVADNLDYLGFDVSDTNIPLNKVEIEEIYTVNFTFKRVHIANKLSLDFYELYERGFELDINKTTILIGKVKGKTDLDLDPITYSSSTITVTGFTEGDPCTFWDLWNASYINGWNVSSQTCENATTGLGRQDTQFLFNCTINIGDGVTTTWFVDTNKQVIFADGIVSGTYQNLITVNTNAKFVIGELTDATEKDCDKGCSIGSLESTYHSTNILQRNGGEYSIYASYFFANSQRHYVKNSNDTIWHTVFSRNVSLYESNSGADLYRCSILSTYYGLLGWDQLCDDIHIYSSWTALYGSGADNLTFSNVVLRNNIQALNMWSFTGHLHIIDGDIDDWILVFGGGSTGAIWRQNTFNVMVVDKDGNPVENADVTLTYQGQGGGTVGSWSTPENGSIPEQTISKGFYNQTGGDTIYSYEPYNLTIEATGYLDHEVVFNVSEPIDWSVGLTLQEDALLFLNLNFGSGVIFLFVGIILLPIIAYGVKRR